MGELSPLHLILVLIIALIVVGPGKLPEVGAAVGKSLREFRRASSDLNPMAPAPEPVAAPTPAAAPTLAPAPVMAAPAVPVAAAAAEPAEPAAPIGPAAAG